MPHKSTVRYMEQDMHNYLVALKLTTEQRRNVMSWTRDIRRLAVKTVLETVARKNVLHKVVSLPKV